MGGYRAIVADHALRVIGNTTKGPAAWLCMLHNGNMSWYAMNQAMADLHLAANRELFGAAPDTYLGRYDLTDQERAAIRGKDVLALWDLGAQPYILRAFQRRNGISDEDFNQALSDRRYEDRVTL
jgi:hypothetical protein